MRRLLQALLPAIMLLIIVSIPVFGYLYRAPLAIVESSGNSSAMLAITANSSNQFMADNGFMNSSANDTRVETLGGLEKPWMVTDNMTLTAVPVPADSQTNLYFTTGNDAATAMDIITGYGGYVTVSDNASLELGDNFTVEWSGWIDTTSVNSTLVDKGAFRVYSASGNVTSVITDDTVDTWQTPSGASAPSWSTPGAIIDDNTGSGSATEAISPLTWSSYATVNYTSSDVSKVRWWLDGSHAADISKIDVDAYAGGTWQNIYEGDGMVTGAWVEKVVCFFDVTEFRFRFYNGDDDGSTDQGVLNEVDFGLADNFIVASVNATGVSSGEHTVKTTANTTDLKIYIDDVEEDSVALSGVSVPDNDSDWLLYPDPYWSYYSHTVNGTEVARYEPASMIIGTNLPDTVGSYNGTITWGTNPEGITVTLGGVVSSGQTSITETTTAPPTDVLAPVGVTDWYGDGTVTKASTLANPFRIAVTAVSDNTELSEIQVWRLLGVGLLLLVVVAVGSHVRGHQGITAIVAGALIGGMVAFDSNIFPLYLLILTAAGLFGGVVAERSPWL